MIGQDGTERKAYYGEGKQPWDIAKEEHWAAEFAAVSILKYLRRTKEGQEEHNLESARIYWEWLQNLHRSGVSGLPYLISRLKEILTFEELAKLQ